MIVKTIQGKSFPLQQGQTVLEAALSNGLTFEYSCKNGQCGVCKTTLIEGQVEEQILQLALSEDEKENNKFLTCCCEPASDILIDAEDLSALSGIESKTLPARINQISFLSPKIVEVTLRLPPTAQFEFLEGQYLDVIHPYATRSYSIASTSKDTELKLLIKKVEKGVLSEYWFHKAKPNDLLRIEGPLGTFFLRDHGRPLVFLATGTGIAPVMAMLERLDSDESFQQKNRIMVFWGNRSDKDFIWKPHFQVLDVEVFRVHSKPGEGWTGEVGYVQDVALSKINDFTELNVYACGSNLMIHSAKDAFCKAGLEEASFYSDAFVQSS